MKRFTGFGLALLAGLIVIIVILLRLFLGGSPKTGPATVTAPAPPAPTAVAPQPAPAPAPQQPPAGPVTVQPGPPSSAPPEAGPPAAQVAPLAPLQPEKQYGFLAGTFRRYPDAAKLLNRLKKQGKPAFIRRDPANEQRYQVWVGPLATPQEAEAAKKSLRRHLKGTPKIEAIENPVPK
ncbi:MAG: SPOR domain-containing protein [Desulfobaccales bacterium]